MTNDTESNGHREARDYHRKWQITKEVSLPSLCGAAGIVIAFAMGYQKIMDRVDVQGETQTAFIAALKDTNTEVRALTKQLQDGSVPSAINARRLDEQERVSLALQARLAQQETAMQQLAVRVAENERRLSTEALRNRAARER